MKKQKIELKKIAFNFSIYVLCCFFIVSTSFAADLAQNFSFDGYVLDNNGNLISGTVPILFKIYNPAMTCLLYEEEHSAITPDPTTGYVHIKIGSGTRTSNDPTLAFKLIFQNGSMIRAASGTNCTPGYTSASTDARHLVMVVNSEVMSPHFVLSPVPMATVAETLQGKIPTDFVTTSGNSNITGNLTLKTGGLLMLEEPAGVDVLSVAAPTLASNYTLTLPSTAGSSGYVLSTDGSGTTSWIAAATTPTFNNGTTGTEPAWSTSGSTHTLNIPLASTTSVTAGLISRATYDRIPAAATASAMLRSTGTAWTAANNVILDASGNIEFSNSATVKGVPAPSYSTDAVPKSYVDASVNSCVSTAGDTMTGALELADIMQMTSSGSASAPALQLGGADTGLFSPNAGEIAIAAGGAEAITVLQSGNVGIGVTSPTAKLHVNGSLRVGISSNFAVELIDRYPSTICSGTIDESSGTQECTMNTITAAAIGDTIACAPTNMPSTWSVVFSCSVASSGVVKVVVTKPVSQTPAATLANWNVTLIKF